MELPEICKILKNPRVSHAAVIGDICIDLYSFVDKSLAEVSVETGRLTSPIVKEKYAPGAASNVTVDCKALGIEDVDVYGVVGDDYNGKILLDLLARNKVDSSHVVLQKQSWATNVYHKIIEKDQEVRRYDIGNKNKLFDQTADKLLDELAQNIGKYDILILNEQITGGVYSNYFICKLNRIIEMNSEKIWLADTRNFIGAFRNVIYKINRKEISKFYHSRYGNGENRISTMGKRLSSEWNKPLVATLGHEGVLVFDGEKAELINGIMTYGEVDTVGAGDAFMAGLAKGLVWGLDVFDSSKVGNLNAAVSILRLKETGHPSMDELIKFLPDINYLYNCDLACKDPQFIENTEIEIIGERKKFPLPRYAIFDHDGTISVLRQGWETVMEEFMIKYMKLGNSLSEEETGRLRAKVENFIERTTGIRTIIQMKGFCRILCHEGLVNRKNDMSPLEFKKLYVEQLKNKMKRKLEDLKAGFLDADDLTIKKSVDFLRLLYKNGTCLYLASGTDAEDTREEANLLGYGNLFGENIYGSLDNEDKDPKRVAIIKIINLIKQKGIKPSDCAVFGDGPVEMREAKKNGFLAVGLTSDEKQRFGHNPAKRKRLILAGADILMPDFSKVSLIFETGECNGRQ